MMIVNYIDMRLHSSCISIAYTDTNTQSSCVEQSLHLKRENYIILLVFDRKVHVLNTCRHFFCERMLALTTKKIFHLTSVEGLRVFFSLVVFPFSFGLVMLIHLVHCWSNNTIETSK